MKRLKIKAPLRINKIMHDIRVVSLRLSMNPCQLIERLAKAITSIPAAPIPPASVGVKKPTKRPPKTTTTRRNVSTTPRRDASFSFKLKLADGGARAGLKKQSARIVIANRIATTIPGKIPAAKSSAMDCSVIEA
jgi:hypothetical protein